MCRRFESCLTRWKFILPSCSHSYFFMTHSFVIALLENAMTGNEMIEVIDNLIQEQEEVKTEYKD